MMQVSEWVDVCRGAMRSPGSTAGTFHILLAFSFVDVVLRGHILLRQQMFLHEGCIAGGWPLESARPSLSG